MECVSQNFVKSMKNTSLVLSERLKKFTRMRKQFLKSGLLHNFKERTGCVLKRTRHALCKSTPSRTSADYAVCLLTSIGRRLKQRCEEMACVCSNMKNRWKQNTKAFLLRFLPEWICTETCWRLSWAEIKN